MICYVFGRVIRVWRKYNDGQLYCLLVFVQLVGVFVFKENFCVVVGGMVVGYVGGEQVVVCWCFLVQYFVGCEYVWEFV